MLDLSELEAAIPIDVDVICALPPLPSLRYVVLPRCKLDDGMRWPCNTQGVFDWLDSCPQLTILDHLVFHQLWPNTCELLLESQLASRLISLELSETSIRHHSVLLEDMCLSRCFPVSAPFPFSSLVYLALPLTVTESGRLLFPLTRLQHLPALHSLLVTLHLQPEDWRGHERGMVAAFESTESAFVQLSAIRTLQQLAVVAEYIDTDEYCDSRVQSVITALFGQCGQATQLPKLHLNSLVVRLPLNEPEEVAEVLKGIARHVDQTTCRQLSIAFGSWLEDEDNGDSSYVHLPVAINTPSLRHLRPAAQPQPDNESIIILWPLSSQCIADIDKYSEQHRVELAARPSLAQQSRITRQLAAADSGQPWWTDAALLFRLDLSTCSLANVPCRRISSSCLWAITNQLPMQQVQGGGVE